jgi:hypothetical protein
MSNRATLSAFALILIQLALCAASSAAAPTSQPAADWARLPTDKWPQLVLTNDASFAGHSALHGASAFLVRMPDGEVLVGTAKHLIKEPGGVNPPVALTDLDQVLTHWKVFPRTMDDRGVEAKGVAERVNGEAQHDWLLLHLANASASNLPATPLIPRAEPVKVGEKVFLIGVPYSDKTSAQNVYKGVVTARPKANYFTYDFDPPVRIPGFSGAPIVDANGLLVGHGVSMQPKLKQKDGLEVEFGGEDASLALDLWRHRNDAPAARAADAVHLELPQGWVPKQSKSEKVLQYAAYPPLTAYFELFADAKADFSDGTDLKHWANTIKTNTAKGSQLESREETELHDGHIGDRATVEYEISGQLKGTGTKVRYRTIMFELNGYFCRVTCWTTPSHWSDAQAKFEEVVRAVK